MEFRDGARDGRLVLRGVSMRRKRRARVGETLSGEALAGLSQVNMRV